MEVTAVHGLVKQEQTTVAMLATSAKTLLTLHAH
jgi:hypothetical protein